MTIEECLVKLRNDLKLWVTNNLTKKSDSDHTHKYAGSSSVGGSANSAKTLDGLTSTVTELNYVDGVTSNVQTQLNGKQANITGAATTITSSNLTASRALVSDGSGKVRSADVTVSELNCLSGVTGSVQTQLNKKPNVTMTLEGTVLYIRSN